MQIPSSFVKRVLCFTNLGFFGHHWCNVLHPRTVSSSISWQWPKYTSKLSLILVWSFAGTYIDKAYEVMLLILLWRQKPTAKCLLSAKQSFLINIAYSGCEVQKCTALLVWDVLTSTALVDVAGRRLSELYSLNASRTSPQVLRPSSHKNFLQRLTWNTILIVLEIQFHRVFFPGKEDIFKLLAKLKFRFLFNCNDIL